MFLLAHERLFILYCQVKLLNESSFASCGKIEDWVSAYEVTDLSESCKDDTMKKLYHKDPSRRRDGAFSVSCCFTL